MKHMQLIPRRGKRGILERPTDRKMAMTATELLDLSLFNEYAPLDASFDWEI